VAQRLDGLVLAGGGDLDARRYGGHPNQYSYMVDPQRDGFELALADYAIGAGLPLLAICRGLQILNVTRGGSLIAHLPERYGERVAHRLPPREPVAHSVSVAPGTKLAKILGEGSFEVMSWHHQAIERLGEGLVAVAHADDGVIEAVELDAPGWLVAVQWHPELNAATSRAQARLFEGFVQAAYKYVESK